MRDSATETRPIFIHSLFRSGSTYMASVFRRRQKHFWCYQEPLNELLIQLNADAEALLEVDDAMARRLRHPKQPHPYFWEFYEVRDRIANLYRKSFAYDEFFAASEDELSDELRHYIRALIEAAPANPVLQFCRSAGRCIALKQAFDGVHIHLWREPRNQWWSMKVTEFFDAALQLIYSASTLPDVLDRIKKQAGVSTIHAEDTATELKLAQERPLHPTESYRAFYGLWLYAFLQGERCADLTISIDGLSAGTAYRESIKRRLFEFTGAEVDFSDCLSSRTDFSESTRAFFSGIEVDVAAEFERHGYPADLVAAAREAQENVYCLDGKEAERQRGTERAYAVALRTLSQLSDQSAAGSARVAELEQAARTLDAELQSTTSRLAGTASEVEQLRTETTHLRAETAQLRAEAAQLREKYDASKASAAHYKQALAEESASRAKLATELEDQTRAIRNLEAKWMHWKAAADRSARHWSNAERDLVRWKRTAEALREEVAALVEQRNILREHVAEWKRAAADAEEEASDLAQRNHHWYTTAEARRRELEAVYASRSWRVTRPMRALKIGALAFGERMTARATRFVLSRPRLRQFGLQWVSRRPRLKAKLKAVAARRGVVPSAAVPMEIPVSPGISTDALSEEGRRVYEALERARDARVRKTT